MSQFQDALWGVLSTIQTTNGRTIYLDGGDVPEGVHVLGQRVRVPVLLFADNDGIHDEYTLHETVTAYAKLTPEEYECAKVSQAATDELARTIAPEIAAALGGYVKRCGVINRYDSNRNPRAG